MKIFKSIFHAVVFALIYSREVVLSTLRIAKLVIQPRLHLQPVFLEVPLDLEGEYAVLLFACLISMTPGTLSVAFDREQRVLLVHFIHEPNPENAVAEVKAKFERPLLRIFA